MKSTKISSLFPKRGNRNTKRTEKHKNKMTHWKTYNKSPRRINHKATKSKTKKVKRKVQGVPQSQTAALPRHQEEEETDKSKQAQTEQTYEKH